MNIVKLQNELRSVPDQALVGYVQNPTGQVPTYLALTELQRRKEMRAQYQKEAPQKSVAESLVEENMPQPPMQQGIASVAPQQAPQPQAPMPQAPMAPQGMAGGGMVSFADGGVAGLDIGDMYDEKNFASGGIVAFADGGDTGHMNLDQLSSLNLNTGSSSGDSNQATIPGLDSQQNSELFGMGTGRLSPYIAMLYRDQISNQKGQGNPLTNGTLGMAQGGYVQNFAKGGTPDDLGVIMPEVPEWDDLKTDQSRAFWQYGVDPEFYAKQARKLQEERDELKSDKTQAGWMGLARAGLGMAAGTSPFALKNISEGAIQGVTQYGADIKDIKTQDRLLKQADMKLSEAQNAQNRGDAQGALKIMDERKNLLLNAQLKEADIRKDISVADAKARAAAAGKEGDLNSKIYDKAQKDFASSFPNGAQETVFSNNPGFFQFVKNVYLKNAQDYIKNDKMPAIPSEKQLLDMYSKKSAVKPGPAVNNPASSINITRPPAVDKIFQKHANASTNKRYNTANTPEELQLTDPRYDNIGPQDSEDADSQ